MLRRSHRVELLGEGGRNAPAPRDEDELGRLERTFEIANEPGGVTGGERTHLADDDDPALGHERWALGGVQHRRQHPLAPFGSARCVGIVPCGGAPRDRELLERERGIVTGEQLA